METDVRPDETYSAFLCDRHVEGFEDGSTPDAAGAELGPGRQTMIDDERDEQNQEQHYGPPMLIGPSVTVDPSADPDVVANAEFTDAPREPIATFLRAAADRLDEAPADETFDLSLYVRHP